ncbi:MAG: hypothetical protein WCK67_03540 [bacterium]
MFNCFKKAKKVLMLLLFICCLFNQNIVLAYGYLPGSGDGINNFGMGLYFAPQDIKIYADADDDANEVVEAKWDEMSFDCLPNNLGSKNMFLAFKPENKIALMIVTDETDKAYEVLYDKTSGAKGWIKKDSGGKFYTWKEFMEEYGKKYGIYIFSGTPANLKKVRTAPDENGQLLRNDYYWAKDINLVYIRGNWMMVKIIDFNKATPVGWIRWRGDNGRIYVFPQIDQI